RLHEDLRTVSLVRRKRQPFSIGRQSRLAVPVVCWQVGEHFRVIAAIEKQDAAGGTNDLGEARLWHLSEDDVAPPDGPIHRHKCPSWLVFDHEFCRRGTTGDLLIDA